MTEKEVGQLKWYCDYCRELIQSMDHVCLSVNLKNRIVYLENTISTCDETIKEMGNLINIQAKDLGEAIEKTKEGLSVGIE